MSNDHYFRRNDYHHMIIGCDYGVPLNSDELVLSVLEPMLSRTRGRPWCQQPAATRDVGSTLVVDKDRFQLTLDVQFFDYENIAVKTADGYIVIEGKHDEKEDENGFISRQFTRKYILPEGCDPETVESKLSSDGVLTVTASRKSALAEERRVPIVKIGPILNKNKNQDTQAPVIE